MDSTNNTAAWVIGAIIVILALIGIWWIATGGTSGNVGIPNTGIDTATSTSANY